MAEDYGQWLQGLEEQNKLSSNNRASDLEKLNNTNPDDVDRVKQALISQYQHRAKGSATEGLDSSQLTKMGYGSGQGENQGSYQNNNSNSSPVSQSSNSYSGSGPSVPAMPDYSKYFEQQNSYLQKMQADADARNAQIAQREEEQKAQRDQLYGTLMGRAQQATNVDANDPIIKGQVDNFRNAQTRSQRDYLSNVAEGGGPLQNMRGEQRMAAEHSGINTANFQGELLGRELGSRRAEISDALHSMGGMLGADQQANLQRELSNIDTQMRSVGQGMQGAGMMGSLGNDLMRAMMQNNQFYSGLGSQNDQFAAQHGLNVADRASYWDALRRGQLG